MLCRQLASDSKNYCWNHHRGWHSTRCRYQQAHSLSMSPEYTKIYTVDTIYFCWGGHEVNSKLHIDRRNVYCSIKLHVHRNKSQELFYYTKCLFQLNGLSFCRLDVKFWLTLLHRLCDITWSDVTIHATLARYVINHVTSSTVDIWLASVPMKWLLFISYIIKLIVVNTPIQVLTLYTEIWNIMVILFSSLETYNRELGRGYVNFIFFSWSLNFISCSLDTKILRKLTTFFWPVNCLTDWLYITDLIFCWPWK